MSHDVETAIIEAIATQRKITINEAKQTLEDLEINGNYHKDVY
jgi:sulfite reductase alpha subunit-like flavoprotein